MELWKTAEAAEALHVGTSSLKRWTDDGALQAVRTPGGHRRYTLAALHAFADARGLEHHLPPLAEPVERPHVPLLTALLHGDASVAHRLLTPPAGTTAERAAFLDHAAESLRDMGHGWAEGRIGVSDEHRATALFAESVDRLRPPTQHDGPLAILACPADELHELPLRLVRVVLEWNGWRTEYFGANLPFAWVRRAIEKSKPRLVAMSSRNPSSFGGREFDALCHFAAAHKAKVIIGGEWARGGTAAAVPRFRSLHALDRWLRRR